MRIPYGPPSRESLSISISSYFWRDMLVKKSIIQNCYSEAASFSNLLPPSLSQVLEIPPYRYSFYFWDTSNIALAPCRPRSPHLLRRRAVIIRCTHPWTFASLLLSSNSLSGDPEHSFASCFPLIFFHSTVKEPRLIQAVRAAARTNTRVSAWLYA